MIALSMDQMRGAPPHFQATGGSTHQLGEINTAAVANVLHKRQGKHKGEKTVVKRTLKYLTVCKDPRAYHRVLKGSTDDVIKTICNAALNVEQGDLHLTPSLQKLFSSHRKAIAKLTCPGGNIKNKRAIIESQKGGFPFIPILIGTALGALGGKLFGG
jgi:hypothetical protein